VSDAAATPSRAVKVTLFEDRAEVVRRARVALRAGVQWVSLAGVTPFVDDRSLQARVAGHGASGVTVIAARLRRRFHWQPAAGREAVDTLELAAEGARRKADAAAAEVARLESEEHRVRQLFAQWSAGIAAAPRFLADEARGAEWRAARFALDEATSAILEARARAHEAKLRADEEAGRAELRLAEGLAQQPRYETFVEVQLEARGDVETDVEAIYRTPCALWRPEHLARLVDSPGGSRLELVTWATAWQQTGEAWTDVEVVFSTARTAKASSPPLLADDTLVARKKTDEERKRVVVEARDQAVQVAGLDRGARAVDEMPGVEDGGEPLALSPSGRVTLVSDGRPFRVEVGRRTLPAEVTRVLFPERAQVAHHRATATLAGGGGPILAGPVRVARDRAIVGRSKIDFVGEGEPFELGFGVDDGVRVRRTQTEERETQTLTGRQTVKRTVKVYLSNLSGERRRVEVTERVPVSEIEDVEISAPTAPWRFDGEDGFARRDVELPPRGTETLTLTYEIKAAAKVVLPF
jgi:uncharacterized protein (TIGR02231 family)